MKATISLTEFVDFVLKSGSPKLTKARYMKNKPEYSPQTDFYKAFREYVVNYHKNCLSSFATSGLEITSDNKKNVSYDLMINGYKSFLGAKEFVWDEPPRTNFEYSDNQININPEIELIFNGVKYVIKMYLKKEEISKKQVNTIIGLLEYSIRPLVAENTVLMLLDVRKGKPFKKTVEIPDLILGVKAECAYLSTIWDAL